MKVILRADIETLGDRDEIKTVADGYARNFLIPKGLAVRATEPELKQREQRLKFAERREKRIEEKLSSRTADIQGAGLEIEENAAADGRLYGSVTARRIAALLTERLGIEINKNRVELEAPIKKVGEYTVSVNLGGEKNADITVKIVSAGGAGESEETPVKEAPAEKTAEKEAEPEAVSGEPAADEGAEGEEEEESSESEEEPGGGAE